MTGLLAHPLLLGLLATGAASLAQAEESPLGGPL